MAFLRLRRSSSNEVFSKIGDLGSRLDGLAKQLSSLSDTVDARLRGVEQRVDDLYKRVEGRSCVDALVDALVRSDRMLLVMAGRIRKVRETIKLLQDNGKRDMALQLKGELEELEKELRRQIIIAIAKLVEEKLLQG